MAPRISAICLSLFFLGGGILLHGQRLLEEDSEEQALLESAGKITLDSKDDGEAGGGILRAGELPEIPKAGVDAGERPQPGVILDTEKTLPEDLSAPVPQGSAGDFGDSTLESVKELDEFEEQLGKEASPDADEEQAVPAAVARPVAQAPELAQASPVASSVPADEDESEGSTEASRNGPGFEADGSFEQLRGAIFLGKDMESPNDLPFRWRGKPYYIRPYFIVSPNPDDATARVNSEVASYALVDIEEVFEIAQLSKDSIRELLEGNNVYLFTKWQRIDPLAEKEARFYGFIYIDDKSFCEIMVKSGLAIPEGERSILPDGTQVAKHLKQLSIEEKMAKREDKGIWAYLPF